MPKFSKIKTFLKIVLEKFKVHLDVTIYFLIVNKKLSTGCVVKKLCPKRWKLKSIVNCTMSKLRYPKKCYVQELGFFNVAEGHRII